jgi:hypothetical protein
MHLDVIIRRQLDEARSVQMMQCPAKLLGEIMMGLDYITEEDIVRALSLQKDIATNT